MKALLITLAILVTINASAQQKEIFQNIKGAVYDAESKKELEGVTVNIQPGNQTVLTDKNGQFYFREIIVGRYHLLISNAGFETKEINDIDLTSGKELDVTVNMLAKVTSLSDIIVKANATKKAKNEFAVVTPDHFL